MRNGSQFQRPLCKDKHNIYMLFDNITEKQTALLWLQEPFPLGLGWVWLFRNLACHWYATVLNLVVVIPRINIFSKNNPWTHSLEWEIWKCSKVIPCQVRNNINQRAKFHWNFLRHPVLYRQTNRQTKYIMLIHYNEDNGVTSWLTNHSKLHCLVNQSHHFICQHIKMMSSCFLN